MADENKIREDHYEGGQNLNRGGVRDGDEKLADSLRRVDANSQIIALQSDAGSGGGASEALTITGLKTDDQVLGVTQRVPGANSLAMIGWNTLVLDGMTIVWAADPGAGAIVVVLVRRPLTD